MSNVQCPICDWQYDAPDTAGEILVLLGVQAVQAEAETAVFDHLQGHTVVEWVKAFRMADAYIEQLEAKVDELEEALTLASRQAETWEKRFQQNQRDAFIAEAESPLLPPAPASRQGAGQAARKVDPNESLIPFAPTATRPEGMVGRKY